VNAEETLEKVKIRCWRKGVLPLLPIAGSPGSKQGAGINNAFMQDKHHLKTRQANP